MEAIFGSPLATLKTEVELLRLQGLWEDIQSKIAEYEGERDTTIQFFEGECVAEISCGKLLTVEYEQKTRKRGENAKDAKDAIKNDTSKDEASEEDINKNESLAASEDSSALLQAFVSCEDAAVDLLLRRLACILLAKLRFLQNGDPEETVELLRNAELDKFEFVEESNARTLRILAEGLALKGLCLERADVAATVPPSVEHRKHIWNCQEVAAVLALQSSGLIPADLQSRTTALEGHAVFLGPVLERTVRACVGKTGECGTVAHSMQRTRWFLRLLRLPAVRVLRLLLARQLAERLLSGITPSDEDRREAVGTLLAVRPHVASEGVSSDSETLAPVNPTEEALLHLQIALTLSMDEIILNQETKYADLRQISLCLALPVLDLCTIAYIRLRRLDLLEATWGKFMSRCYTQQGMLLKYARVLVHVGKFEVAIRTLLNSFRQEPDNREAYVLAAQISLDQLGDSTAAETYAEKALALSVSDEDRYLPLVLLGICYAKRPEEEFREKASSSFTSAAAIHPNDYRIFYNKALHEAMQGALGDASVSVRRSLELNEDDTVAWHLCAVILTALGRNKEALEILEEYVGEEAEVDLELCLTHLAVLERMGRVKDALALAKSLSAKLPVAANHPHLADSSLDFEDDPATAERPTNTAAMPKSHPSELVPLLESPTGHADSGEVRDSQQDDSTVGHITLTETNESAADGGAGTANGAAPGLFHRAFDSVIGALGLGHTTSSTAHQDGAVEAAAEQTLVEEAVLVEPVTEPGAVAGMMQTVFEKIVQVVPFTGGTDEVAELAELEREMATWTIEPTVAERNQCVLLARIAGLQLKLGLVEEAEDTLFTAEETLVPCHLVEYTKGLLAMYRQDDAAAKVSFEVAVMMQPTYLPAWLGLVDLAVKSENSGLLSEHLALMRKFCKKEPEPWFLSAQFLTEMWEDDEGSEFLEEAQRLLVYRPVRSFDIFSFRF